MKDFRLCFSMFSLVKNWGFALEVEFTISMLIIGTTEKND